MQQTTSNSTYDLLIIGAGPIGLACGIEAKKAGLNYLILEKGALCNSIYNYPVNMTFFPRRSDWNLQAFPSCLLEPNLLELRLWIITEGFTNFFN